MGRRAFLGDWVHPASQVDLGATVSGYTVKLRWGWGGNRAFPATKTIWTYRAIYRAGDDQVGLWSNAVSVTVQA